MVGPRAFGAGLIIAVIWTGGFGGAFAGIIATLAETHMSPLIVYIVIAAAAVIEGIGLWLAIRSMLRRDEIRAKDGKFLIVARGLNGGRKEYDWSQISSFQFEASGVSSDNRSVSFHILSMNVGGQKVMLWSFFITTTGAEQRWILTELRAFFAPIWQRAAAQSPDHPA